MGLKLIVDKLEDVPEALRDQYAATEDGKFRLGVEGIEDTTGLKKALSTERKQREDFEKRLKAFDGVDPEEARALHARLEGDEELQLMNSGNKEKLRERWLDKMRKDYEKKLADAATQIEGAKTVGTKWQSRVLDNAVREAATKVGLHSYAVEDALSRGRAMFQLDDEGNAVQIRDGSVVLGKDGTPYSPAEWLESMRETAPHWFPAAAAGSGASQQRSSSGNGSGKVIKRSAFDSLDHKARAAAVKDGMRIIDG